LATTTRYEIKYHVSVAHRDAITRWLSQFMEPDAFGEGGGASYSVHSLYLDSDTWSIFEDTSFGRFRRFKLRARTYAFTPDANVFLEVKSRAGEAMWKTRGEVPRSEAIRILNGEAPLKLRSTPAVEAFRATMDLRDAVPKAWVTYRHDAWVGFDRDNLVRVTFDYYIRCAWPTADLSEPPVWYDVPVTKNLMVLELKYTHSYPPWISDLIRHFDLNRQAMSKYRHSIEMMRGEPKEMERMAVRRPDPEETA
jgi:hypothetical protein